MGRMSTFFTTSIQFEFLCLRWRSITFFTTLTFLDVHSPSLPSMTTCFGVGLYFAIFFAKFRPFFEDFFFPRNLFLFSCVLRNFGDFFLTSRAQRKFRRNFVEISSKFRRNRSKISQKFRNFKFSSKFWRKWEFYFNEIQKYQRNFEISAKFPRNFAPFSAK